MLGQAVRRFLREEPALRDYMFAKFDCSDIGCTVVRLRPKNGSTLTEE